MSAIEFYTNQQELKKIMSAARATITAPFFGNNVEHVKSVAEAYKLALRSPGTIELTGMPVYMPEKIGLPKGANQLLFNDGSVVGRCAAARKIVGEPGCDLKELLPIIREAAYASRYKLLYKTEAIVGLEQDFMIKAHLLIPAGFENIMYSWLLNFQYVNEEYANMYENSRAISEGEIFVFSDPDWSHPDFPYGLTFFDPEHNVAAILGMRYFGEHKKGTLTLAWGCAARNGYASCHGGMKRYNLRDGKSFQAAVFGLSGSGKSTLISLIARLYDVTSGTVKVGGRDVREYNLQALRNEVSVVLQKNTLFTGTVEENLRWGNPDATDEEIKRACDVAAASPFVEAMKDGYKSHVEQGGTNFSGGQKQRLCIARALLKKPKILIMDDSTSAVDTATDASIRKALKEDVTDLTKIIISQRVSSVMDADQIVMLKNGRIDDIGTHSELLERNDDYRDLYETQTRGGNLDA